MTSQSQSGIKKHPYGPTDWLKEKALYPVAVSSRDLILYGIDPNESDGTGSTEYWTMQAGSSAKSKLNLPNGFDPIGFVADGSALFGIFQVKDVSQLAILRLEGISSLSTPKVLTSLERGIGGAKISPDGMRFAILADPSERDPLSKVRRVFEPRKTSIFVVNADGTEGRWWAPDLVNISSLAWSQDGQRVAILSHTPKIGNHHLRSRIDIASSTGTANVAEIDGTTSEIAWADGGQDIAFLATTTSVITPDHVWTVPTAGGKAVDRTPDLRGTARVLYGDAKGSVWVEVARGVETEIHSFSSGGLKFAYSFPGGAIHVPLTCQTQTERTLTVSVVEDPSRPPELCELRNGVPTILTSENADWLSTVVLGPTKVVRCREGVPLEGIATFPGDFEAGKRYPFLVLPHGGPEDSDRLAFNDFGRFFAGLGYVVLQPEYRGSTGYGSEFLNSIYQHFGDWAYRDVDSATDFAISQGWADPNRLAIMGWSAGGFLTAWTVTQTHRYKAAIEGAGITDWLSFIWTSDVDQTDYDARWPGKDPGAFLKFSAVNYADRVTTPILILHGASDRRVPTFQGQEFYEALTANGKAARMVIYPGAGHFPDRADQWMDVWGEMAAWLDRYNPSQPTPGNGR